jgi:hypothetical protein
MKQRIKGEIYTTTRVVNNLLRYIDLATEEDIQAGKMTRCRPNIKSIAAYNGWLKHCNSINLNNTI